MVRGERHSSVAQISELGGNEGERARGKEREIDGGEGKSPGD